MKSDGGLWLPEQAQGKSMEGVVMAVGADCDVFEGDRVLFSGFGTEVKVLDQDLVLVKNEKIYLVFDDEPDYEVC